MAKMQRKILLVDDAPEDRAIIKHYLLQDPAYDYHIWEEESGENALATYRIVRPDCLLLDYTLPDCDGLQFLIHLSEHLREQAPAVVMLTGTGNEVVAVEAMKRGVQDYLHKDALSRERLWHAVANAVEKAALRQALDTERQQAKENETRLRLALEAAHMIAWEWDAETDAVTQSLNADQIMELASSKLVTSRHEFFTLVHPEDQPRLLETLQTSLREQTPYILEFRRCCPDGVTRWMEAHGRPRLNTAGKPTYLSGVMMDITARKQAEEALGRLHNELERRVEERTAELAHTVAALRAEVKERKQAEVALQASDLRYRSLFENAAEGIFLSTPEGRILDVNPALVRMLGYDSADEMLALHLPEDLYVNLTDRVRLLTQFEAQGTIDGVELPWKKKDGAPMVVSLHARTVLDAQGTVVGYEGMVLDITERKQAEQALEALSRRVLEVQETERRALARELHDEMGQALMALRLNLRAAQRTPHLQSARLKDSLSIVDTLVQQVRQLSLDLRPSLLDDVGLVAALRWYVDRLAQRAGLVIHFSAEGLESRHSPMLETTCFRLTQEALTNVLRHARAHHVWIEVRQHNQELHLRIRDDGIGFDVRAVRERTSQGESLGILGMEERVRLVEGQFSLTSVLAHGTEIYARFPLAPSTGATIGLASLGRMRPSNTDDKKST